MTVVELVPHMDAGNRELWPDDQDLRPLSELGRRQAEALARALSSTRIGALCASPALRARQTLEPLAEALGLAVVTLPALAEKQPGEDRAAMVDRAHAAMLELAAKHRHGRAVAASHGDLIPALAAHLAAVHRFPPLPPLEHRGQWYTIHLEGDTVRMERHEVPSFPL